MKYAVKVKLSENDWLYVTEDIARCDLELRPMLFDSREHAELFAQGWRVEGKEDSVAVVEFDLKGTLNEY